MPELQSERRRILETCKMITGEAVPKGIVRPWSQAFKLLFSQTPLLSPHCEASLTAHIIVTTTEIVLLDSSIANQGLQPGAQIREDFDVALPCSL